MRSTVCTLFEKDFHYGLGALVNSLHRNDFRGVVWAGYRGSLPPWAQNAEDMGSYAELAVAPQLAIRFVPLDTPLHFAHYKPTWMLQIMETLDPQCEALFYFDPDIVIKCRWEFFEKWVTYGIALCQDVNYSMPSDHPIRKSWEAFARERGYTVHHTIGSYYNSGFLGVKRQYLHALELWKNLINQVEDESGDLQQWRTLDRTYRFWSANQDTLNLLAMLTEFPLSTVGPDGMDFIPGGYIMSHAIGALKPWNKRYIRCALGGSAPTTAEKLYWENVEDPLRIYSPLTLPWHRFRVRLAATIGRFIRRI